MVNVYSIILAMFSIKQLRLKCQIKIGFCRVSRPKRKVITTIKNMLKYELKNKLKLEHFARRSPRAK